MSIEHWPVRIFMCGFMGSGKSTVGLQLAEHADIPFHDLDTEIVEEQGMAINEIFSEYGEAYFRKCERSMVQRACNQMDGVIALGGGALQDQQVVDWVRESGFLVYMAASLPNLIKRIKNDRQRPLLLNADGQLKSEEQLQLELGERYRQRQQWYRQAHLTVQTDRFSSPQQVTKHLIEKIEKYEKSS